MFTVYNAVATWPAVAQIHRESTVPQPRHYSVIIGNRDTLRHDASSVHTTSVAYQSLWTAFATVCLLKFATISHPPALIINMDMSLEASAHGFYGSIANWCLQNNAKLV